MKKLNILFIIIFGLAQSAFSQTVDSIKVEQAGDKLLVHYKILQSNETQTFKVTLVCILSTGAKLEPASLSGDFGENVPGGKTDYTIIWDVLRDLEELQSAEFSVKAELVKGNATHVKGVNLTGWDKKRFHIMALGSFPGPKIGLKIGYIGSWGISAGFAAGKPKLIEESPISKDDLPGFPIYSLELTKRIINRNGFQFHFGVGYARTVYLFAPDRSSILYEKINFPLLHPNLLFEYKRIAFSLGAYAPLKAIGDIEKSENKFIISNEAQLGISLGVRF